MLRLAMEVNDHSLKKKPIVNLMGGEYIKRALTLVKSSVNNETFHTKTTKSPS